MGAAAEIEVVITDTSVLINLAHTGHLFLLGQTAGYRFFVPEEVIAEVQDPGQQKLLSSAIANGFLARAVIDTTEELTLYAELNRILGSGESACLALATLRGWCLACDERRVFLREARTRIGEPRLINTPGLYLLWIRLGLLSVADADLARQMLEARRFRMTFGSFRDLI